MATTINTYSVGLTLNAADYINKAALSATESRRMARAIESARDPAEKFTLAHDRLTKALEKGGISHEVYNRLLDAERAKLEAATASTQQAKDAAKAMESTMAAVNGVLAKTETTIERNTRLATEFRKALVAGKITQSDYARGLDRLRNSSEQARLAAIASSPAVQLHNQMLAEGRQVTLSLLSPMERHSRELERINKLHRAGVIDNVTYRRAIDQADASLKKHNATVQATSASSGMLATRIKSMIAGYVGFHTVIKSVGLAVQAEQAAASFEILTGSIEGSRAMLRDLADFAARSPITLSGTQDAAKTMMAFNIPAREVMRNIQMLGDISMGNQQRFDSLTLAFSQMSAAGRLMGQDLLQMINAGFNPLQEISRKTGESITDLKTRMEQGGISAQEVTEAFESATAEGGKFAGMTDRLADTMGGKMAVAMSNLEQAGAKLGEAIGPLVIALTDGFNESSSAIQNAIWLVEKFADGLGFVVAFQTDMMNALANWDFNAGWDRANAFLDSWEQRQREREAAMKKASTDALGGADGPMAGMASVADATAEAFEKQLKAMELQVAELTEAEYIVQRMRWEADGFTDAQIEQLDRQAEFIRGLKEEQELLKKNADEAKRLSDEMDRDLSRSISAANEYFQKERQRDEEMRKQISQGPQSIEAGSDEAAKYLADQMNAAIGAAAVPERPTPGEEAIIQQAQKELEEAQKQTAKQEQMLATLRETLAVAKDNGFKRIR